MSATKVAPIIIEFLKEHWPLDTEGLTAKEIVDNIHDFQRNGAAWERTATLEVGFSGTLEVGFSGEDPDYLYWESGSRCTAMVIDGHGCSTAAMADCGSSVPDVLEMYASHCRDAGLWPVQVFHLHGDDGPMWVPAGAVLAGIRATTVYPHVRHPER